MSVGKNKYIIKDDCAEIIIEKKDKSTYTVIIDLDDVEKCKQRTWCINYGPNKHPTARTTIAGKAVQMHRFIMGYVGELPIDHINRNPLDNRKENLRIVLPVENSANNGAKTLYMTADRRWEVRFTRYYDKYVLGPYDTKEEALAAKQQKIEEIDKNINEPTIVQNKIESLNKIKNVNLTKQSNKNKQATLNTFEKYIISVDEASEYFSLEKDYLLKTIHKNPNAKWILWNGKKPLIKRNIFEDYLNGRNTI